MPASSQNNKRIAKNTLMLYFRQILIMLISLYTVRVLLEVLGVVDYGIYNVVGGIVTMFSFLSGTMSSASQRYFSYDLGKRDYDSLKRTFSLTMLSYICIAIVVLIICETVGVWFLNSKMTIPAERINSANWVLQASIGSFVLSILTAPYMAVLIARERMSAYAYISILEVSLKLIIVVLLQYLPYDKLRTFAILTFASSFMVTTTYRFYCKRHFDESHYAYYWDWGKLKDMLSFAGWNMIGSIANVLKSQGINILLNLFFNPVVNAARGIAFQILNVVNSFTTNFYTAVRPQIVKLHASGDNSGMLKLINQSSRFAFYLMALLITPFYVHIEQILGVWLVEIPEYTVIFTRLILITILVEVYNYPIVTGIQATGKIKNYQIAVSILYLLNLPVSYIALNMGAKPEVTMVISIVISVLCVIPRLIIANRIINLQVGPYLIEVIGSTLLVFIALLFLNYGTYQLFSGNPLLSIAVYVPLSVIVIFLLGLKNTESTIVKNKIFMYVENFKRN